MRKHLQNLPRLVGWWVCHRTRFSLCRLWTVTERPYSVDHMGQFLQGVLWSADTSWHRHHGNLKVLLTNWPGWGYKTKSWPIHSALANFTAFGNTFAIKIVSNPKKSFQAPGFAFEKSCPCSRENEVKISEERKMAKNHFMSSDLGS